MNDIEGLIIVLDRLGRSLAQAEQAVEQLQQENAALKTQLAAVKDQ